MRKISTRTRNKKLSKKRYALKKTRCRHGIKTCRRIRRKNTTKRKHRVLTGASNIDDYMAKAYERMRTNDTEWYNKNVLPAQQRNEKRQIELLMQDQRMANEEPASIARMGDPKLMEKHLETMKRAENRQREMQREYEDNMERAIFQDEILRDINPADHYEEMRPTKRRRISRSNK